MADLKKTIINDTGSVELPTGTGTQRPTFSTSVQQFTSTGNSTFTVPSGVTSLHVLVVGGGGGGGNALAGGGGAGGYVEAKEYPVTPGEVIPVTVGAGGGVAAQNPQYRPGYNGGDSVFGSIRALGGGAGAGYSNPPSGTGRPSEQGPSYYMNHGYSGGSGGGGGGTEGQRSGRGEARQSKDSTSYKGGFGAGFPGGSGFGPNPAGYGGGGGGGAGGRGSDNRGNNGGDGGPGLGSDITGSFVMRAGGGGGSIYAPPGGPHGTGGAGGGGNGGRGPGYRGTSGTINTGGGGGGGEWPYNSSPSNRNEGGPGVVIVKYNTLGGENQIGNTRFNTTLSRTEVWTGGKWEAVGAKTVTKFTSGSGNFTVPNGVTELEVLVVAGGGGGGSIGGGGGGGGVVYNKSYQVTPGSSVPYTVGGGGARGGNYPGPRSANGNNSVFGTHTALGGGGAGSWNSSAPGPGGSGSGGRGDPGVGQEGGIATQPYQSNSGATNYGFPGAAGGIRAPIGSRSGFDTGAGQYTAGGGGGAGRAGGFRSAFVNVGAASYQDNVNFDTRRIRGAGRHGGDGVPFDIDGEVKYYGGGGGGGAHNPGHSPHKTAIGGLGGGGNAGSHDLEYGPNGRGQDGEANTGGGGGGGYYRGGGQAMGGDGGSGVIIVRY